MCPYYFELNTTCLILRDIVALIASYAYARRFEADRIRIEFRRIIILAPEFLFGADSIASVIEPDYYTLGILMIFVRLY